ncbi:MAG: hypothetical protein ACYTAF_15535 [Planctomycetota bacterium]
MSDELRRRLERFAEQSQHRKNWIIVRALEDYLDRHEARTLRAEARRQSLRAGAEVHPEDDAWAELADSTGWK